MIGLSQEKSTEGGILLNHAINLYQQSLEDLLIFLFFGVGAKVIVLFVIRSRPPKVPRERIILWYGLGAYWVLSAIIQMWPTMGIASVKSLNHPMLELLASLWGKHPVASSLWSVVIQMAIGIVLLTERENLTGKITLILSSLFSTFLWIFGENWGGLTQSSTSLIIGSPGAGLLALLASLALIAPASLWTDSKVPTVVNRLITVFWSLGTLWQLIHFNTLPAWQGIWIPIINRAQPHWILALRTGEYNLIAHHTLVINLILGVVMVAGIVVLVLNSLPILYWSVLSLNLLIWWGLGQGFGFRPAYGAGLNTAPLIFLLILSVHMHFAMSRDKKSPSRLSA